LNNGSGDGVFAWANPAAVPTPANSGYEVVFTPRDPNAYDYTGVVMRKVVQLVVNKANQTITFPAIPAKTYGDAPFSAQASVNTGLPLTYSSSNSRIAAISASGMITILGAGRVTIVAQHSGNSNYNAAIQSRILTIKAAAATDVPVQAADGGIAVYPNPAAAGMLYIGGDFAGMVQIYTLSGSLAAVSAGAAISVAHLPSGIYIVRTGSKAAKILIINN
jgi:hypothetical protein